MSINSQKISGVKPVKIRKLIPSAYLGLYRDVFK